MGRMRLSVALGIAIALTGCNNLPPARDMALPAAAVVLASDGGYLKLPMLAGAAAAYLVMDPLAPNWTIEEVRRSDDRYQLALRHKAIHNGGDGEARQVFVRRAEQLADKPEFGAYEIVKWQTGIDNTRPFAQRVAYGEVRLVRLVAPKGVANSER